METLCKCVKNQQLVILHEWKFVKTTCKVSWSLQCEETRWNPRVECFQVWKLVKTTCEVSWSLQCEETRWNPRVDCFQVWKLVETTYEFSWSFQFKESRWNLGGILRLIDSFQMWTPSGNNIGVSPKWKLGGNCWCHDS